MSFSEKFSSTFELRRSSLVERSTYRSQFSDVLNNLLGVPFDYHLQQSAWKQILLNKNFKNNT